MTTCPTHRTTPALEPVQPHNPTYRTGICKGCDAPAGSDYERRSHHCPCCGERLASGCTGQPVRHSCPNCGTFDTSSTQWLPSVDPIIELLADHYTPTPWFQVWAQAAIRFGYDVAHHLAEVTTEIDRTHLYGEIVFRGSVLVIRHGRRGFEAASDCPRREECRRGRVWTPVQIREDLLNVRLNGPGPWASECDRASRHS
ncbi:hypothetical protein ACFV2X_43230 [Streptomyces sp. NPDC059679]|uniref:hypothetical protein n=1 Tax=Streptomyces sp. NPDC059679 TaxID=3346903 RepID=UPI0036BBFD87